MLCVYMGVWRSSTRGKKKVSSVVLRDWRSAKRRRKLSIGTSAGRRWSGMSVGQTSLFPEEHLDQGLSSVALPLGTQKS